MLAGAVMTIKDFCGNRLVTVVDEAYLIYK